MDFRQANLTIRLLAGALSAAVLPVVAQTNAPPSSQPIIFSVPAGDEGASNAPSLSPRIADQLNFASELRAPVSLFNVLNPSPPLPAPPGVPTPSRTDAGRLQKTLDLRDNWVFMTPEEILSAGPLEDAFWVPEQETADDRKKLTLLERFLERQRQTQTAATNRYLNGEVSAGWNFSRNQGGLTNESPFDPVRVGPPIPAQMLDRFIYTMPADNWFAGQNENGGAGWFKSLGLPPQPAPPTQEQLAQRERFRQLLEPDSYNDKAARPLLGGKFLSSLQPLLDTTSDQTPAVNPAGASFTPLSSRIGRPAGLTPLPGIISTNRPLSAPPPAWAPQPPPWLLPTPQPFTMPQRKF
jgi:hypothetical protein